MVETIGEPLRKHRSASDFRRHQTWDLDMHKILIVDDEAINLGIIGNGLENFNKDYEVLQTDNGEMAFKIAVEEKPDLIITDWAMPRMDGIQLIRHLKSNENTQQIPVIMCTGVMTSSENLEIAFEAGAMDYIRKPIDIIELYARVRSMLALGDTFKKIKEQNERLENKKSRLEEALEKIKTLKGLIPLCSSCKKVRDDNGFWKQVEAYIETHSDAKITHSLCPDCLQNLYPDYWQKILEEDNKK